jgi:hypothetical protein
MKVRASRFEAVVSLSVVDVALESGLEREEKVNIKVRKVDVSG